MSSDGLKNQCFGDLLCLHHHGWCGEELLICSHLYTDVSARETVNSHSFLVGQDKCQIEWSSFLAVCDIL
jgi:hypothetical protein